MLILESQKENIIEDYKHLSLTKLAKKYNSTRFLIKSLLVKNGIEIKNYHTAAKQIFDSGVKQCTICNFLLPLDNFGVLRSVLSGIRSECKKCRADKIPDRREYSKKWRLENKELKSRLDKEYRKKNADKIRLYKKSEKYKKIKALSDKKQYEKIKKDPIRLLTVRMRSSLSESIRFKKDRAYFKMLGYTVGDLKNRLESTFTNGMSWDNYGRNGWHIDHIKPLVLFDLAIESEFIEAWSLNNLQALWEFDNCSKGSLYENIRHQSTKK